MVCNERKVFHLNSIIKENGIRISDAMIISPIQGRVKEIPLMRTEYIFNYHNDLALKNEGNEIFLGSIDLPDFYYKLSAINFYDAQDKNDLRYEMIALSDHPFRLNGNYCTKAFICRGDVVDFFGNRIKFKIEETKKTSVKSNFKEDEFLKEKFIKSDMNVLLEGETGTGKTRLAKMIHDNSGRSGEFVHINLSSFAPTLLESELFGHIKGAFTGAINSKRGAILEANRGTLFLDEIDSISKELQTKLLLFFDNKKIRPVGGHRDESVDVRVIVASGRSLEKLVEQNEMRKDFFYRISTGAFFRLAPLRERVDFIEYFVRDFITKKSLSISLELVNFYKQCKWPGNVRQLLGHLEKKCIMKKGATLDIDIVDEELVSKDFDISTSTNDFKLETLENIKESYVYKVYLNCNKDILKSAKILDISNSTVREFVKKFTEKQAA